MNNLVHKLEAKGVIPSGKYAAVYKEDNSEVYMVKTANGKWGMYVVNPTRIVLPKFEKIEKDSNGNYICLGMKAGKSFIDVYDKDLLLVELKTEEFISTCKVKATDINDVAIIKEGMKFGLANKKCMIFPKFVRIDLSQSGNFICYFLYKGNFCKEIFDAKLNPIKEDDSTSKETTSIWTMDPGKTLVAANNGGVLNKVFTLIS